MAKIRVAILGGGAGGLSAAWHLTRTPELRARFEVTVHQMGWRLGGQGASGRNREHHDRIEEHGLHIWLGFYENAFRMMRDCYAEWAKARDNPLRDWTDAFKPQTETPVGLGDGRTFFQFEWPTNADSPGDGGVSLSPWGAITEAFNTLRILLGQVLARIEGAKPNPFRIIAIVFGSALRLIGRLIKDLFAGRRSLQDVGRKLRVVAPLFTPARTPADHMADVLSRAHDVAAGHAAAKPGFTREAAADLLWLLEEAQRLFHRLFDTSLNSPHGSLVWRVLDMALATLRGLLNPAYGLEENLDLNRLDEYEFLDWLVANGADPNIRDLTNAPELRALYDLAFSYRPTPGGLVPDFAAGAALRCMIRILATYKGAPLYEMQAGMGEAVIAPLYEVLKARGVRVEFFHKVRKLELSENGNWISRIHIGVQALSRGEVPYDPLFSVDGVRCWPSHPFWEQLENGEAMRAAGVVLDSHWCGYPDAATEVLTMGIDFDMAVLAINIGALQRLNDEDGSLADALIDASPAFRATTEKIGLIPTFGLQLWMTKSLRELGWRFPKPALVGSVEPVDVWADSSQLLIREQWPFDGPRSSHMLCGPWCTDLFRKPASDRTVPAQASNAITDIVTDWLNNASSTIWPATTAPGGTGFDWNVLYDRSGADGPGRLQSQWIRPNVEPSECCAATWTGTTKYRLRTNQSGIRNLFLAGTWGRTGTNTTCLEAAVMSGMAAARALSGEPLVIIGEHFLQSP
jgi:uncharacterized protein with NAD-binding domain and iron-sulfur cluster